ncbi:MAG: hypothetical protein JW814_00805 [Candidatus Krumholzibacteriota bacterium]|nr:hypothetical protein [Candidatus Krumholzibacteriota bacterium]
MKYLLIVSLVLSLSLAACFDDNPSKPKDGDEEDISPYTGTFTLDFELLSNTCAIPAPPGNTVNITIIGDSLITFGTVAGDWDSLTTSGSGVSDETTVPVIPPDCYSYYTVTFNITFSDLDNFTGTYGASYRKDEECPNPDPCSFEYSITGTR